MQQDTTTKLSLLFTIALLTLTITDRAHAQNSHRTTPYWTRHTATKAVATSTGRSAKVWLNDRTGVYHYAGSRWYGRSKGGRYVSESTARTLGAHAARNGQ